MDAFNEAFEKFSVTRCLRKAHLFAQILQEVGSGIVTMEENLNYSAESLKSTRGYFGHHPDEADLYGGIKALPPGSKRKSLKPNIEAIANLMYAKKNGNSAEGDGWHFRGRGFLQITGKDTYLNVQNKIRLLYPESGIDISSNVDDLLTKRIAMIAAMAYWVWRGLNVKADANGSLVRPHPGKPRLKDKKRNLYDSYASNGDLHGKVVDSITKAINSYTNTYAERRVHFEKTKQVFSVSICGLGVEKHPSPWVT